MKNNNSTWEKWQDSYGLGLNYKVVNKWTELFKLFVDNWNLIPIYQQGLSILKAQQVLVSTCGEVFSSQDEEIVVKTMVLWKISGGKIRQVIESYWTDKYNFKYVKEYWEKWSANLNLSPRIPIREID